MILLQETGEQPRSVTVCGGESRIKHIYTSDTNTVEIRVLTGKSSRAKRSFLLQYEG